MAKICNIYGVPRNTQTMVFISMLNGLNFDIVQNAIISPKGKEITSVNKNKSIDVINPLPRVRETSQKSSMLYPSF